MSTYKIVDLEADITAFKEKFAGDMPHGKWLGNTVHFEEKIIKCLVDPPVLENFIVSETDDYGRPIRTIGIIKATSWAHALLLMALAKNNCEIFLTGFYSSREISDKEIKATRKQLENDLKLLTIINTQSCPRCNIKHDETDCNGYCSAACLEGY